MSLPSSGRRIARRRGSPPGTLLAAVTVLLAACGGGSGDRGEPAPSAAADHAAGEVARYDVLGVVLGLPDASDPLSELVIRHQAIDDFVGIDGRVVGMDSMSMPFPLADGVDLGGLAVGDRVDFSFEVEWEGEPPYRVTRIEKLPADTELDLRRATPSAG